MQSLLYLIYHACWRHLWLESDWAREDLIEGSRYLRYKRSSLWLRLYLPGRSVTGGYGNIKTLGALWTLREHALNVHLIWIFIGTTAQNVSIWMVAHSHVLKHVIAIEISTSLDLILEWIWIGVLLSAILPPNDLIIKRLIRLFIFLWYLAHLHLRRHLLDPSPNQSIAFLNFNIQTHWGIIGTCPRILSEVTVHLGIPEGWTQTTLSLGGLSASWNYFGWFIFLFIGKCHHIKVFIVKLRLFSSFRWLLLT